MSDDDTEHPNNATHTFLVKRSADDKDNKLEAYLSQEEIGLTIESNKLPRLIDVILQKNAKKYKRTVIDNNKLPRFVDLGFLEIMD